MFSRFFSLFSSVTAWLGFGRTMQFWFRYHEYFWQICILENQTLPGKTTTELASVLLRTSESVTLTQEPVVGLVASATRQVGATKQPEMSTTS